MSETANGNSTQPKPTESNTTNGSDDAQTNKPVDLGPPVDPSVGNVDLPDEGLPAEKRKDILKQFEEYLVECKKNYLGYQNNQNMDYTELAPFLNYHINNIGDTWGKGNLTLNTKTFEKAVLDYFARLWNAGPPHKPEEADTYWGYVLSMGSTEGNMYALRNARDYLAGKILSSDLQANHLKDDTTEVDVEDDSESDRPPPRKNVSRLRQGTFIVKGGTGQRERTKHHHHENDHAHFHHPPGEMYTPVLFYSVDSHYSISKIKDLIALPTFSDLGNVVYPDQCPYLGQTQNEGERPRDHPRQWPENVPSNSDGSIDINALYVLVDFFASRGHPIIINFNLGTTFKGAYDHVDKAVERLLPMLKAYHLHDRKLKIKTSSGEEFVSHRTGYWFHVDGALGAAYIPYLIKAEENRNKYNFDSTIRVPRFGFEQGIQSIVMSGHKDIGTCWPTGVYMTKTKYLLHFTAPDYVGALDSTMSGSRNGFSSLKLWHYLSRHSVDGHIKRVIKQENMAGETFEKFVKLEKEMRGKDENFKLYLERSPLALTIRFRQPNKKIVHRFSLSCEKEKGVDYAHIYIMDHVTSGLVDELISALSGEGAFEGVKCHLGGQMVQAGSGFK